MDFAEAIEFSQKFPIVHPKIFKGFNEWGIWDKETEGYVVLTDAASHSVNYFPINWKITLRATT